MIEEAARLFVAAHREAEEAHHVWLRIAPTRLPHSVRQSYLDRMREADDNMHEALGLLYTTLGERSC